jgi:hypothetical protein
VNKDTFAFGLIIFLITVFLSGCTENNNSNDEFDMSNFIGTWAGNLESTFKGRTANITELTFIETIVDVTMVNNRGIQTMTYTYKLDGDKLVLETNFNNRDSPEGRQPPDEGQSSLFISFVYNFDEECNILYLNGSGFIKAN